MFWSQQSISTLINPPFALSLIILFLGLRQLHKKSLLWSILLFGSLAAIKIYASVLVLAGLGLASLINKNIAKIFFGSLLISLCLFLPLNSHSSGLLVWQPGWFLETMMGVSDRVNWPKFYSAMLSYKATRNPIKFPLAYLVAFGIFVAGNLGTRIVGLWHWRKIKGETLELVILVMVCIGFLVPQFILQSGTPWNTIQFTYYSQALMGLLAGISISEIIKKTKFNFLGFGICVLVIALTIPTTIDSLKNYLPSRPPAMVSREELDALKFLSHLPHATVLTYPVTPDAYAPPPRPLYLYESTAYVSALSNQPVFVEDYVNLNITGFDWQTRKSQSDQFFQTRDLPTASQFLTDHHITYIYLPQVASHRPNFSAKELGGQSLFENSVAAIWQVPTL